MTSHWNPNRHAWYTGSGLRMRQGNYHPKQMLDIVAAQVEIAVEWLADLHREWNALSTGPGRTLRAVAIEVCASPAGGRCR
jgi:hypothetical protein